jgi:hypothetical protein
VTTIGALVPPVADVVPAHAAAAVDAVRLARCYDEDALYWLAALAERCDRPVYCVSDRSLGTRGSPEKASEHPIWMHRD